MMPVFSDRLGSLRLMLHPGCFAKISEAATPPPPPQLLLSKNTSLGHLAVTRSYKNSNPNKGTSQSAYRLTFCSQLCPTVDLGWVSCRAVADVSCQLPAQPLGSVDAHVVHTEVRVVSAQITSHKKDLYRREGKGRRCWGGGAEFIKFLVAL